MKRVDINTCQPRAYQAMLGLEQYLSNSKIDAALRELIRVRASLINKCHFCIAMHAGAAERLGVPKEKITALAHWQDSKLFNDQERAALAMTDAMTKISEGGVSDEVYGRAATFYADEEMVQLIILISTINAWNRIGVSTAGGE